MTLLKVKNSTNDYDDCNHYGVFSDTDCLKVHSLRVLGYVFSQTEFQTLSRFSPKPVPGSIWFGQRCQACQALACVARQAHILEHVVLALLIPLIFANIFDRCAMHTGGQYFSRTSSINTHTDAAQTKHFAY